MRGPQRGGQVGATGRDSTTSGGVRQAQGHHRCMPSAGRGQPGGDREGGLSTDREGLHTGPGARSLAAAAMGLVGTQAPEEQAGRVLRKPAGAGDPAWPPAVLTRAAGGARGWGAESWSCEPCSSPPLPTATHPAPRLPAGPPALLPHLHHPGKHLLYKFSSGLLPPSGPPTEPCLSPLRWAELVSPKSTC